MYTLIYIYIGYYGSIVPGKKSCYHFLRRTVSTHYDLFDKRFKFLNSSVNPMFLCTQTFIFFHVFRLNLFTNSVTQSMEQTTKHDYVSSEYWLRNKPFKFNLSNKCYNYKQLNWRLSEKRSEWRSFEWFTERR